ncbi:XRCC4-like factor-domain-containing protein [Dendryphion nanum]|uniref:Non-homologous end-joining factor 1 n=1 Tax=Dendryphion nanum TaxID=256645 RepID=A0A9P9IIS5_9PLEO|nr:XRCC4-like factor-domain-containing protein [Dendryphion nanum]
MSCWRVLQLDESSKSDVPQLLIKPVFGPKSYTIFLTDLSNIWGEDLDLDGILQRSSEQKSPIEVSKHDTSQLPILLSNIAKSLTYADDTVCRITRDDAEGVILHTNTRLPEPLDSLRWRFMLKKQAATTLKNELILPLLVSAHIQHERVNNLTSIIQEKDRAITRLVDQYESSHLDLASVFPSIGGSKPGRRIVKREQAARHIPALRDFEEKKWKRETSQLRDGHVCELGLFQEALSECNPEVPTHMRSDRRENAWWQSVSSVLQVSTSFLRPERKSKSPQGPILEAEDDETETEDEFETHENFKSRGIGQKDVQTTSKPQNSNKTTKVLKDPVTGDNNDTDTEEDDDGDLDTAPRRQSHSQSSSAQEPPKKLPARVKSPELVPSLSPSSSPSPAKPKPSTVPKGKGFKIGGTRTKSSAEEPPLEKNNQSLEREPSPMNTHASQNPPKRGFVIGGKRNPPLESREASHALNSPPIDVEHQLIPNKQPSPQRATQPQKKVATPEEEEREETAEEKAERRRRELKRKNEELAKKQAQKKKKRF